MAYSDYIITYIDLLGFKNLVEVRYKDDPKPVNQILKKITDANRICNRLTSSDGQKIEVVTQAFSDSVVRSIRIRNKTKEFIASALNEELFLLALIQIWLLDSGVLIRGCINVGQMYSNDKVIYGPAYNEAYEYESSVAIYPIIIISPSVLKLLASYRYDSRYDFAPLICTNDMQYNHCCTYLNYMYLTSHPGILANIQQVEDFIVTHRNIVSDELQRNERNIKVFPKYLWLKKLHNHYVPQIEAFKYRDDLLIN